MRNRLIGFVLIAAVLVTCGINVTACGGSASPTAVVEHFDFEDKIPPKDAVPPTSQPSPAPTPTPAT